VSRATRPTSPRPIEPHARLYDNLPSLQIVPTERIFLHEEVDANRVDPLGKEMRKRKVITNPPLVAPVAGRNAFVLLDGANRVMAALQIGLPHMLVQVVDYRDASIVLSKWDHVVTHFSDEEFFTQLLQIRGIDLHRATLASARRALERREIFCFFHHRDWGTAAMSRAPRAASEVSLLRAITGIYKDRASILRVQLKARTPRELTLEDAFLLAFPTFTKRDIVRCALSPSEKLPTGISRHIIPNRALKVNFPIEVLRSRKSVAEKTLALTALVAERARHKSIRHYTEATFIYDE
jgi:hypothetical protein